MKKKLPLFVVALALLVGSSLGGLAKSPRSAKRKPSGIYGKLVQIGFPPEHPSMGREMPLADMLVGIYSQRSEREIKRVTTDKNGLFRTQLPPGTYIVAPIPPDPDPRMFGGINQSRKVVRVRRNFYTETKAIYDAGW